MATKELELVLRMDGQEVSRPFGVPTDAVLRCTDDMVETLGASIVKGLADKPDIIIGMLIVLLEKVKK